MFLFSPSRSAELPGCQPPGVAHTRGGYVLLVASDGCVHHALQTQPVMSDSDQQKLRETPHLTAT